MDNVSTISQVGVTTTTAAASSAAIALPTNEAGAGENYIVRVVADGSAFIKFGGAAVVATTNDILITNQPSYFEIHGLGGFFAVIENLSPVGVSGVCKVSVTPLDNVR